MDPDSKSDFKSCKLAGAKSLIKEESHLWFGTEPISPRDHQLISCDDTAFAAFGKSSYLSSVYHLKHGEGEMIQNTRWTCENDIACKKMVAQAGGGIRGFPHLIQPPPVNWLHMKVNVSLTVSAARSSELNVSWGILSTRPTRTRIFEGPSELCPIHPLDVMIMYDCTPSTENFIQQPLIASRKWDILLMKMCEDYDYPWVVLSMVDSGSYSEVEHEHRECYSI
ncbi:hypothetical protein M434DRAFT_33124 [Hypoxylon sp. CO27-5]|nr:hypothetical protein M434DRAFT_33124 [Hypoxylon sp. CO27-5]